MPRLRLRRRASRAAATIFAALPVCWILWLGDALGTLLAHADRQGRAVALQNLTVAFGEGRPASRRIADHVASRRCAARALLLSARGPLGHYVPPRDGVLVTGRMGLWRVLRARWRVALAEEEPRSRQEGAWAPFLGLPAWTDVRVLRRARERGLPVRPVLLAAGEDGRCSLWVGPDLAAGVRSDDPRADVHEIAARVNGALEHVVRARPDLWDWTWPRLRVRPTPEMGPYPRYSRWVPGPK